MIDRSNYRPQWVVAGPLADLASGSQWRHFSSPERATSCKARLDARHGSEAHTITEGIGDKRRNWISLDALKELS